MNTINSVEKVIIGLCVVCGGAILAACTSMTRGNLTPVQNFELERYLGDWYEIGRFDFKWEKNMKNVKTTYSLNKDGTVKVENSGWDYVTNKAKKSVGKAKFAGNQKNIADLKVAFFGPFYTPYKVIALDPDYNYALVAGKNKKLLWILSRTPDLPIEVRKEYVQKATYAGFDMSEFVWTLQE